MNVNQALRALMHWWRCAPDDEAEAWASFQRILSTARETKRGK